LTEIALAGRVAGLFTQFARRARTLGLEAGLVTHNPVMAAEILGAELDAFAAIIAPCNSRGYKMVPERAACEAFFRTHPGRFWAAETTAGGHLSLPEAFAHPQAMGLAGSVVDFRGIEALFDARRRPIAAGRVSPPTAPPAPRRK
jgi:hypothetical protein